MEDLDEKLLKAALLHDIGKLIFRTGRTGVEYNHAELGYEWARKAGFPDEINRPILYHHGKGEGEERSSTLVRNLTVLVSSADRISAGMERDWDPRRERTGRFDQTAVLKNIMSTVDIGKGAAAPTYFSPQLASFPALESRPTGLGVIWDALVQKISPTLPSESLLFLLERYTSNIPEYTYRSSDDHPSTSLYHHLKSTAAIALADYVYITSKLRTHIASETVSGRSASEHEDEERFLLVAADVSGIQDFIYGISSKKALRLLRARSFFVELLGETALSLMIERAGLHRACVVYSSGGGFTLLAPNTDHTMRCIKEASQHVNSWLYSRLGPSLYVATAWVPVSASGLKSSIGDAWREVHAKLNQAKNEKWRDKLDELLEPTPVGSYQCECCGRLTDSVEQYEDFLACDFCSSMIEFGKALPESRVLWASPEPVEGGLEVAGVWYGKSGTRQYVLSTRHEPELCVPTWKLYSGSRVDEVDLSVVADSSTGAKRLGVLRMDVDSLGKIFSRGLQSPTLARVSDLSARFDWFFKVYVPGEIDQCLKTGLLDKVPRKPAISVVYSGGDDLFLIGSWDQVLEAAFWIRDRFVEYTGYNPNITVSAGMIVADERIALRKLASEAGEEESSAKDSGRDRISFGGICMSWSAKEDLFKAIRAFVEVKDGSVEPKVSRHFLNNLKALIFSKSEWRLPRVYYTARRAKYPELVAKLVPLFYREDLLRCAVAIADLVSRRGDRDGR